MQLSKTKMAHGFQVKKLSVAIFHAKVTHSFSICTRRTHFRYTLKVPPQILHLHPAEPPGIILDLKHFTNP